MLHLTRFLSMHGRALASCAVLVLACAAPAAVRAQEPAKAEPAKTEPSKTEPAPVEPAKTEPAKTEPAKAEPAPAGTKAHAEEPDCEDEHAEHHGEHQAEHGEHGVHGEHHSHHANDIGIFAGATTKFGDEGHTGATFGLDYERRLPFAEQMFGVGALVDMALMEHTSVIVAPALYIHPAGGLKITLAPGVEHEGEENVFVMRGGLAYVVHFGALSVGPSVAADYANKHVALVHGLTAGLGF